MRISDWSSDVCSSDLVGHAVARPVDVRQTRAANRHAPGDPETEQIRQSVPVDGKRAELERDGIDVGVHEHGGDCSGSCVAVLFGQRSEEHTSELQSLMRTSYAVFCLQKKKECTD